MSKLVTDFLAEQDLGRIMTHHADSKEYVKNWHKNIRRWRALYDFLHYSGPKKKGEHRYADPTPTNIVDLAVGIFLKNRLEFKAVGWTPSLQEEKWSSKIEKYLVGALDKSIEREEYDIVFDVVQHFVRDGAAVLYSVWDPQLDMANRIRVKIPVSDPANPQGFIEKAGLKEVPERTQSIDPLKISMVPGGAHRWLHVFRTEQRTVYDVEAEYGISIPKYGSLTAFQKQQTSDEFIDYWRTAVVGLPVLEDDGNPVMNEDGKLQTEDHMIIINAVLFGGIFLKKPQHMVGYDEIPYSIGLYKPSDKDDPNQWHNILRPVESSIRELEYAVNRRMHQINIYSGLPLIFKADPARPAPVVDPGFANFKRINTSEEIAFPQWPGNAPDVQEHIGYLRSRLQQAGFTDVMYGMSSGQANATFAIQQLQDQNRIRLEQPARQLEILWNTWARKILSHTSNFAGNSVVRVYGSLKGKEFAEQIDGTWADNYAVRALIQPEMPGEDTRKHAMATQVKGMISNWTISQKYLDIKQPDEERDRQLIEAALQHPAVMQYAIMKELMDMADEGDVAALLALQAMQNGMGQGSNNPNGRPTAPTNSEQPIGLAGPTGQPNSQFTGGAAPGQSVLENQQSMANARPGMNG